MSFFKKFIKKKTDGSKTKGKHGPSGSKTNDGSGPSGLGKEKDKDRAMFDLIDTNKDGKISKSELKQFFSLHGEKFTDKEIDELFGGKESMDSTQFEMILAITNNAKESTDYGQLFDVLDKDGNGEVDIEELHDFLKDDKLADAMLREEKQKKIKAALKREEFVSMMEKIDKETEE